MDTASVKSKKGLQGALQPARKAPYKIGKLEVQLLFVPKPHGASDVRQTIVLCRVLSNN